MNSHFYQKSYLNYKNYNINTIELEKNIIFLSKFPKKLRVDIFASDDTCHEYLDKDFIKISTEVTSNGTVNKKLGL